MTFALESFKQITDESKQPATSKNQPKTEIVRNSFQVKIQGKVVEDEKNNFWEEENQKELRSPVFNSPQIDGNLFFERLTSRSSSTHSKEVEQKLSQVEEKFSMDFVKDTNNYSVESEPLPEHLNDEYIKKQLKPFNRKNLLEKCITFDDNLHNQEIEKKVLKFGREKATKIVKGLKTQFKRLSLFDKQKNDSYVYPNKEPKAEASLDIKLDFLKKAATSKNSESKDLVSNEGAKSVKDSESEEVLKTVDVEKDSGQIDYAMNLNSKKEVVINKILESGIKYKRDEGMDSKKKCMKVLESEYNSIPDSSENK